MAPSPQIQTLRHEYGNLLLERHRRRGEWVGVLVVVILILPVFGIMAVWGTYSLINPSLGNGIGISIACGALGWAMLAVFIRLLLRFPGSIEFRERGAIRHWCGNVRAALPYASLAKLTLATTDVHHHGSYVGTQILVELRSSDGRGFRYTSTYTDPQHARKKSAKAQAQALETHTQVESIFQYISTTVLQGWLDTPGGFQTRIGTAAIASNAGFIPLKGSQKGQSIPLHDVRAQPPQGGVVYIHRRGVPKPILALKEATPNLRPLLALLDLHRV